MMLSSRMCALQARHSFAAAAALSKARPLSLSQCSRIRPHGAVSTFPLALQRPRSFGTQPPTMDKDKKLETEQQPAKPEKMSIKKMFKEYGLPFLVWETVAWLGTGVVVYGAVSTMGGYDAVLPTLKSLGVDKYVDPESIDPRYGDLAIAIAVNEALEVFRFPVVVATTPLIVKWWRARRLGK